MEAGATQKKEDLWIHTACGMCVGDCGILVHRVDGVVVDIKGDPDCPNSRGKLCSKGYAGIMHLYDPNRVLRPMKRTNPEKGLGIDPGWVPISWGEAFDILVDKLAAVRGEDPRKLVFTTFDVYAIHNLMAPWARAFGTSNTNWGGYYCGQYLHSSMYLTNGTFHSDFDGDYVNYLLLFGNQAGFGAGLNPNITAQKIAARRKEGLKVVVVDPVCGPAGSKADEWVPIRPGTDTALVLAMINVLVNELELYDREFAKTYTNGPYLVGPDGFYVRQDGQPLLWDLATGEARPYSAGARDQALEGTYAVGGVECRPAFQLLREHVNKYTPEMAEEITTVPAATIRRLAGEFGREARVGSTIAIDGVQLPYRPVAANIYRGAGAHKHGVSSALAVLTLNLIMGAFYVPGGHRGQNLIGPSWEWAPGTYDGLITPPDKQEVSHGADYYTYEVKQPECTTLKGLFPISTNLAPMNLAASLEPEKFNLPYKPEVLISCRRNVFMGGCDYRLTTEVLKKYKFIAAFCITLDEMSEFADLVLPESMYLEKLEVLPNRLNWSHSVQTGYFYWGVRQPVVAPRGEARDWADVLMEIAERMGFLGDVYRQLNLKYGLTGPYALDPARTYTREEIGDRRFKSQFGDGRGLEWFKKNGYLNQKRKVDELFPLPWLKVRFPLYYENVKKAGLRVKEVTERMGLADWDVSDYEELPEWKQCASYAPSGSSDLIVVNYRIATHFQSWTAQNPWLSEVAERNPYAQKILIHPLAAKSRGIRDNDAICVESSVGRVRGTAKITEGIHPEVIGMASHFGSFAKGKPVAYGKGANFNTLIPYDTDPVSTGIDACVRASVYRGSGLSF